MLMVASKWLLNLPSCGNSCCCPEQRLLYHTVVSHRAAQILLQALTQ
jgi:hypothetical protein